jgi:hypothetical protein
MFSRGYQLLQCGNVTQIVARFVYGRLEDKRFAPQSGVVQNAAEAFKTNITFTYVGVPIYVRVQARLSIVRMNHWYVFEP